MTTDNVIQLFVATKVTKCMHNKIEVDERELFVVCGECGVKLNPVDVLIRYAKQERYLLQRKKERQKLEERLDKKMRCKCEHCQRITRIRRI